MEAGKKKERLVQFHKKNILDAAEMLFSEKGIGQTTMDDIAREADYSKSTIYVYFKSKEEIYHHIIFEHMCQLKELAQACAEGKGSFEMRYYSLCDGLTGFYEQYPLYFVSMMGRISVDEKDLQENTILKQIYDVGEEINAAMLTFFHQGIEGNDLRGDISIMPAVFTIWASLGSLITMAYEKEAYILQRMNMKREEFLRQGFEMLLDSVRKERTLR